MNHFLKLKLMKNRVNLVINFINNLLILFMNKYLIKYSLRKKKLSLLLELIKY